MPDRTIKLNVIGDSTAVGKMLDDVASKSEGTAARAKHAFSTMFSTLGASGVLGPFQEQINQVSQIIDRVTTEGSKKFGTMLMAGGGGAMAAGGILTASANKDVEASNQLKQAIENAGGVYEEYEGRIDGVVRGQEKFGTTANTTKDALRILTTATQDPEKAMNEMGLAADIAASKHISLADASDMLAKAYSGNTRALKQFGIDTTGLVSPTKELENAQKDAAKASDDLATANQKLDDLQARLSGKAKLTISEQQQLRDAQKQVADATAYNSAAQETLAKTTDAVQNGTSDMDKALGAVADRLHGQAAAAADSWGGKLRGLKAWTEDHVAELGQKYGPALMGIGAAMTAVGGITETGAAILGKFATAQDVATVATEGLTVAESESAVAEGIALGPILLIIAAIAVLAVGIYELIQHWDGVKNAVTAAWNWVWAKTSQFGSDVKAFFIAWWPEILGIFTLGLGTVVGEVYRHWDDIVGFVKGLPGRLRDAAVGMWDWISNGVRGAINDAIGVMNAGINFLNSFGIHVHIHDPIPGMPNLDFDWNGLGIPHIPSVALGGIATSPTLALIGDNPARREAIVPLERAQEMGFGGGSDRNGSNGGPDVIILQIDGREITRVVRQRLIATNGRNFVTSGLG